MSGSTPASAHAHAASHGGNVDGDWILPLTLSLLAGLSTCLGAAVVFCTKKPKNNASPLSHAHMAFSLALAASVMVTVSVVSILPESFQDEDREEDVYHMLPVGSAAFWTRCVSIAAGCGLYFLLSKCAFPEPNVVLNLEGDIAKEKTLVTTPKPDPPAVEMGERNTPMEGERPGGNMSSGRLRKKDSVVRRVSFKEDLESSAETENLLYRSDKPVSGAGASVDSKGRSCWSLERLRICSSGKDLDTAEARRAWRVAMLLFVSIAVHNFPEGLAVAASTLHSPKLGWTTATAIALHNIPEGIAIAVPCLAARPDSPWLAFGLASLSGLAEPLGAAVALAVIRLARQDGSQVDENNSFWGMNNILAFVAGVMVMVACTELFPEALRHSLESKTPLISGSIAGAVIMIGSDMILDLQDME